MRRGHMGLATRLTLAAAAAILTMQILMVAAAALVLSRTAPDERPGLATRIAAVADIIDQAAPEDRARLATAMTGRDFQVVLTPEAAEPRRAARGWRARLEHRVTQTMPGRVVQVSEGERRGQARVRVTLADGTSLVAQTSLRPASLIYALTLMNLIAGLMILAAVWIAMRALTGPLQHVADRARRFADDLDAEPIAERGPAEARQLAAALNRLRSEVRRLMAERMRMLAAIAHDLKTYLTRLRLRAALIEDEDQRAAADRDIRLMARLIEDTLAVAQGESRPPKIVQFDLGTLCQDIVAERRRVGDSIAFEPPDAAIWAIADPDAARRSLDNVLDNAIKFAGSADLRLSQDAGHAVAEIIDRGPGLPDEAFDRVTEPFYRLEPSRSQETGGAGLGLAIVQALMRQIGGRLDLSPTPGGGLTVRLELPAN